MTETRRRGRPRGSGIDDHQALRRVAELLIAREAPNVAAAVRQFAGHDPSLIRRLQRKFHSDGARYLEIAAIQARHSAIEEGIGESQMRRSTQPLKWRHEHDTTTRLMDALMLEQDERLRKLFKRT